MVDHNVHGDDVVGHAHYEVKVVEDGRRFFGTKIRYEDHPS
jgi:hypothetical protein